LGFILGDKNQPGQPIKMVWATYKNGLGFILGEKTQPGQPFKID
jgi:hypothetical protein